MGIGTWLVLVPVCSQCTYLVGPFFTLLAYQNHMRSLPAPAPCMTTFRQRILSLNNLKTRSADADLDETYMLYYMIAGAKLSQHSAVIGTSRLEKTSTGVFDGREWRVLIVQIKFEGRYKNLGILHSYAILH